MVRTCVILNFHGLGKPGRSIPLEEEPFWLDVAFFEAIIDLIQGREDVQITFDDSNASDYQFALPALKARNLSAKIFVLAKHLGQKGYLSIRQLGELVSEGMTIGSHGMEHRAWTDLDDTELRTELVEAKDRLEQLSGKPVSEAACPFGMYNRRVLRAVRNFGCDRVYTSDDCPAFVGSWIQSRYTILRTHHLSEVEKIINCSPRGLGKAWPRIKLGLKQLR